MEGTINAEPCASYDVQRAHARDPDWAEGSCVPGRPGDVCGKSGGVALARVRRGSGLPRKAARRGERRPAGVWGLQPHPRLGRLLHGDARESRDLPGMLISA